MPAFVIYFIRHGETVWNAERRLQGQHDSELTAKGRSQADRCGRILHELLAHDGKAVAALDFVASPLGRARATMERLRTVMRLAPADYRTDARLAELAFGRWEGLAYPELLVTEKEALAAREKDKWNFMPPEGESYAALQARVHAWHEDITGDTVAVAHGGTARALWALHGIAEPEKATVADIQQGVVYRLNNGTLTRHG